MLFLVCCSLELLPNFWVAALRKVLIQSVCMSATVAPALLLSLSALGSLTNHKEHMDDDTTVSAYTICIEF
jgi:hypothetical protein